jgi:hypothetical protein
MTPKLLTTRLDLAGWKSPRGTVLGLLYSGRSADVWYLDTGCVLKWHHGRQDPLPNLSHDHLVPILDQGEAWGRWFEIYPYIKDTLESKWVSPDVAIPQISSAVRYLHERGFVHRDIQPKNIFVRDGAVLLGDFGHLRQGIKPQPWVSPGNGRFQAPETRLSFVSSDSDWHSVGMVAEWLAVRTPDDSSPKNSRQA